MRRSIPDFSVAPAIQELSGAAFDRKAGVIWSLGDHGNDAALGQTSLDDLHTRKIPVSGATNQDWEAMLRDDDGHLWILDVGDNQEARESVAFYEVNPALQRAGGALSVARKIIVTYPTQAENVEGAVYRAGRIYLFEKTGKKTDKPVNVYAVRVDAGAARSQKAELVAQIPPLAEPITDAAVSPSGAVYLLTKTQILQCVDCLGSGSPRTRVVRERKKVHVETLIAVDDDTFVVGTEKGQFSHW